MKLGSYDALLDKGLKYMYSKVLYTKLKLRTTIANKQQYAWMPKEAIEYNTSLHL